MNPVLIFKTKLNGYSDYSGFDFFQVGSKLTPKDKSIIEKTALEFYNSYSAEEQTMVKLSIGIVTIKSSPHPTVSRRKSVEGYIDEPANVHENVSVTNQVGIQGNQIPEVLTPEEAAVEELAIEESAQEDLKSEYVDFLNRLLRLRFSTNTLNQVKIDRLINIIIDEIGSSEVKIDINLLIINHLKLFSLSSSSKASDHVSRLVDAVESKLLE